MIKKFLVFIILSFCTITNGLCFSGDSIQISLLTVKPRSNEVYTVYGHTALRVIDYTTKKDIVFNYGMFDSSKPNFIYHYIKGETDYSLAATEFDYFNYVYTAENSTVIEQVLDLPQKEKEEIIEFLLVNLRPENREYRYNNFFDNCSTRPRDILEKYCGGTLVYPQKTEKTTIRRLVHECTNPYPWMTFGIDLLIGNGADSLISYRSEMFLPLKLKEGLDGAHVVTDSLKPYQIVSQSRTIINSEVQEESEANFLPTPIQSGIILLLITLVVAICSWVWKRQFKFFFGLLFLVAGLLGCIVAFVSLISTLACTWPNLHLLWLHPFHLIAVIGFFLKKTYRIVLWFHGTNFVLLSSLLLFWCVLPQEMNVASIPFMLCLWISSGYQLYYQRKNKIKL